MAAFRPSVRWGRPTRRPVMPARSTASGRSSRSSLHGTANIYKRLQFHRTILSGPELQLCGDHDLALQCPSDPLVANGDPISILFYTIDGNPPPTNPRQGIASYAANAGMWLVQNGPWWGQQRG